MHDNTPALPSDSDCEKQAQILVQKLRTEAWRVSFAESCTGGLLSGTLTRIPGSSDVFELGIVTYSNQMKQKFLNVQQQSLERHGAVSSQVVEAMVCGLHKQSQAELTLAISGIAGPGGGTLEKPLGLVWFGLGLSRPESHSEFSVKSYAFLFPGKRESVRKLAVHTALKLLNQCVEAKMLPPHKDLAFLRP